MQYLIIMILVNNFNDGETCYKGGGGHRTWKCQPSSRLGIFRNLSIRSGRCSSFAHFYLLTPVLTNKPTNLYVLTNETLLPMIFIIFVLRFI